MNKYPYLTKMLTLGLNEKAPGMNTEGFFSVRKNILTELP